MKSQLWAILIVFNLILSGCIGETIPDLDKDGIEDSEDSDRDGDGWDNSLEINCTTDADNSLDIPSDLDQDMICDLLDHDIDGDDWSNDEEVECQTSAYDFLIKPKDLDNDGICDFIDEDIDGDKLPNSWEEERNFDPLDSQDAMICQGLSEY